MKKEKEKVLTIIGPTSVGKTALSLRLADDFQGEIISGDSMQFYQGMDIGTAKATMEERALVPHHLIDICHPDELFTVADFQRKTKEFISEINNRNRLPMIVGGTGLYIQSVLYTYHFSDAGEDPEYREKMERLALKEGHGVLHSQLAQIDPLTAQRLHPNDLKRVIRALEIFHLTGETMAQFQKRSQQSPYDLLLIGLNMERSILYERINQRVDRMVQEGLIEEVEKLLARGYDCRYRSMQALGYKELVSYLQGDMDKEEAIELIKKRTRNFAKRQLTWFRNMKDVVWFDLTPGKEDSEDQYRRIYQLVAGKFRQATNI